MLNQIIFIFKTVTGYLSTVSANLYSNIQQLFTLPVIGFLLLTLSLLNLTYSARLATDYLGRATRILYPFKHLTQLVSLLVIFSLNILSMGVFEPGFLLIIFIFLLYWIHVYVLSLSKYIYDHSNPWVTGYMMSKSLLKSGVSERKCNNVRGVLPKSYKGRTTNSSSFSTLACSKMLGCASVSPSLSTGIVPYNPNLNALAVIPDTVNAIIPFNGYASNPIISYVPESSRVIQLQNAGEKGQSSGGVVYLDYLAFINSRRGYENGSQIKLIGGLIFQAPLTVRGRWIRIPETSKYVTTLDFMETYGVSPELVDLALWTVELYQADYNKNLRCITFKFNNTSNVSVVPFMFACLSLLYQNDEFLNFGINKSIISTGIGYDHENDQHVTFSLHKNVLVKNTQSPSTVLLNITHSGLKNIYSVVEAYGVDYLSEIHIKVWNLDMYANKRIKINKKDYSCTDLKTGKPIKNSLVLSSKSNFVTKTVIEYKRSIHTNSSAIIPKENKAFKNVIGRLKPMKNVKSFGTGDIETVNINGLQIPICISACYDGKTYFFIVDKELMLTSQKEAVQNMFNDYFDFVIKQKSKTTFYHNLGRFDGRFIFEALIKYAKKAGKLDDVDCLMDTSKSFINISYSYTDENDNNQRIVFQDSLRLFGVSLKKFCKVYNVEGKISDYNMDFNRLDVLDNDGLLGTLKEYSLQDSKCLYDALFKAQSIYFDNYTVDIVSAVSTASLSMKIFRTHFINNPIPILNGTTDQFVRRGYFGGATDCYHKHGKDLYYYDVNSLYPYVMKKKMPTNVIKRHTSSETIDLDSFFGYIECVVHAPDDIKNPIIPLRTKDKTLYPTGSWKGVYFSEMIKEALKYGYKFEVLKGIEFEGEYIFAEYIDHFYKIKAESKAKGDASLTFLAKMHLNQLYGVFGRKNESISTIIIDNENIVNLLMTDNISTIIEIDDDISLVLIEDTKSGSVPTVAEFTMIEGASQSPYSVRSNVAIAAAVTAYGQIEMMKFKNNPEYNMYYTDTDSIVIDKPLPENLVGNSLGQLKNETLDKYGVETISDAYFLGIKKYGYRVVKDNSTFECSIFAGVQRDTVPFESIVKISSGEDYTVKQPSRLYNSSNSLSIVQKDSVTTTITMDFHKQLVDNFYRPIKVENKTINK